MKNFALIFIVVMAFSCRPSLKIQKTQEGITKLDTAVVTVVANTNGVDSAKLVRDVYKKVLTNKIDFNTFSAKVKVDYQSKDASDNATAYIRIYKDSLIWISLRGPLGIEGARALITKDSVILLNTLKKEVTRKRIAFLQEIAKLPVDYFTLQDVIIGNPVYVDSNITSYTTNNNSQLEVVMLGKIFEHLVTLNNSDFKILHSRIEDRNADHHLSFDIVYNEFDNTAGIPFAVKRNMTITDKNTLNINLDFKSFAFNQPVTFPFAVTSDYKQTR